MDTPEVMLTGEGIYGLAPVAQLRGVIAALPKMVKLGRIAPKSRPQALRLESFIDKIQMTPKPSVDWYTKAAESISRMYLNDRWGCCVFSGKAHNLGIWSANDPDSFNGQTVLATDAEIQQQYFDYTGGRDTGAVIFQVLDYMTQKGFLAGGQRYKLSGYVSADWRSKELVQIGLDLFGCASIGINLPSAWTSSAVWDVTNTRIVGGHDVSPCGYSDGSSILGTNSDGVVVSSWGRLYLITWKAFTSSQWLDELYFAVPEFLWTGLDKRSPSGADFTRLKEALALIGGGNVPPLPDPTPTPPPVPPSPPIPPTPPVPPVPTTITIPKLNVRILGVSVGSTDPVTITLGDTNGLNFEWGKWIKVFGDVGQLISDAAKQDWLAVVADVKKILADLGYDQAKLAKSYSAEEIHLTVDLATLIADIGALVAAVLAKNVPAVIVAGLKVLADLGISL